ncbi:MAG TPA: DUF4170 domain-containing protein [Alphaproteobacteria bacterium]|nr:DUF4170 domain-containing protein [Alphaproteobacteria bacterium]
MAEGRRSYWVVGGEYRDPNRYETVIGEETWLGPFASKDEAHKVWKEWAWKTVDNAQIRYRVVEGAGPRAKARP